MEAEPDTSGDKSTVREGLGPTARERRERSSDERRRGNQGFRHGGRELRSQEFMSGGWWR